MTQKQRMEQGLIYDPTADEIMNEQTGEAQYLKEYNSLGLGNEKRIEELLRLMLAECGENCYLQPPFYANWGGAHLHLGNNVYANFNLTAVDDGHIYIGDCTMIGPNVTIATAGHPILPSLREKAYQFNLDVHIGKNVWIGAGAVILPGVSIGDNSVIGAGSIVRRIDDLGRIVIPKEIRRSFRIKEGDPLEIFTDAEGEVIFKKYSPIGELSNFASQYAEVLHKSGGLPIAIMDNDHVVAASGISKREILERRVTKNLEELMENRAIHITNDKIPSVNAIEGYDRKANIVYPIIYGGDVSGAVCMMEDENHTLPSESDIKLVQVAAAFLGKQME